MEQEQKSSRQSIEGQVRIKNIKVIAASSIALLVIIILVIAGFRLWGVLTDFIHPKTPADRKDLVNVFVVIAAGVVGSLTAIAAVANLYFSRRNLQNAQASLRQQRDLDERRAQEDALQAYFEQMGTLLTTHNLIGTEREDIRQLAEAQTLTVSARLDGPRKGSLVRFLHGAGLISKANTIVSLRRADLRCAELSQAYLSGANLLDADLSGAIFNGATLHGADLIDSYLTGANFSGASLHHAELGGAILHRADFSGAFFGPGASGASFGPGPDLRTADLSDAKISEAQLAKCKSLEDATMPNGQKYEEWLGTPDGQDWLRKYKKNLGALMKKIGEYETWIQTTEGQMWSKAIGEDGQNSVLP